MTTVDTDIMIDRYQYMMLNKLEMMFDLTPTTGISAGQICRAKRLSLLYNPVNPHKNVHGPESFPDKFNEVFELLYNVYFGATLCRKETN